KLIQQNIQTKSSTYLLSVKVLQEKNNGINFSMRLQGKVNLQALKPLLEKLSIPQKNAPWYKVTLLVEGDYNVPKSWLKKRLRLFHLNLNRMFHIPVDPALEKVPLSTEKTQLMFKQFSQSSIIYLLQFKKELKPKKLENQDQSSDTAKEQDQSSDTAKEQTSSQTAQTNLLSEKIKKISLRIFKKTGFQELNSFELILPKAITREELKSKKTEIFNQFLKLFSLESLKTSIYEQGTESSLVFEVKGLSIPYARDQFEEKILKQKMIRKFQIGSLTSESVTYRIQTRSSSENVLRWLNRLPSIPFKIQSQLLKEENKIKIEVEYLPTVKAIPAKTWVADFQTMENIRKTFKMPFITDDKLPKFYEIESNNNSWQVNELSLNQLLVGNIVSRTDEDIFRVAIPEGTKKVKIEWARLVKTNLRPEIRIYDHELNYLTGYQLPKKHRYVTFPYQFQGNTPQYLFIRILDRVGFIQGEPGGYKSYQYYLRVTVPEKNQIKKTP
ncbi:MAG: hypothetical protein ACI86H_000701, partial [bacterium]